MLREHDIMGDRKAWRARGAAGHGPPMHQSHATIKRFTCSNDTYIRNPSGRKKWSMNDQAMTPDDQQLEMQSHTHVLGA